jgi:hypothetical protein
MYDTYIYVYIYIYAYKYIYTVDMSHTRCAGDAVSRAICAQRRCVSSRAHRQVDRSHAANVATGGGGLQSANPCASAGGSAAVVKLKLSMSLPVTNVAQVRNRSRCAAAARVWHRALLREIEGSFECKSGLICAQTACCSVLQLFSGRNRALLSEI